MVDLKKNLKIIELLINKYIIPPSGDSEIWSIFFESDEFKEYLIAPASYRTDYVACYMGGLCELGIETFKSMWWLYNRFGLKDKMRKSSIVITSLFCNLGKVGTFDKNKFKKYFIEKEGGGWI